MSDDDDRRWPDVSQRQVAVAAVVLAALVVAVAAAVTYPVSEGARFETDTGATVVFGSDTSVESGNPFTAPDTVELGGTEFRSPGASKVRLVANSGTWTNVSQADVTSNRLFINRSDTNGIGIGGTVDAANVSNDINLSKASSMTDLIATAGGDWTLVVNDTGLAQGTGLVVVDQGTGDPLDSTSVGPNGHVVFDDLGSVSATKLNVKQGPAELKVFEEESPSTLVDGITLRVRVFGQESNTVIERSVTDGTMDLTGIPSDERLVLTVNEDSTNDYAYRRIIIESVEQQQEVYLLNTTSNPDDVDVVFELQDRTGNYPAESTRLYIEKPITKDFDGDNSNETRYQTVAGDLFGGTGEFVTVLEGEERYRLRIENAQGDTRMLGSYTAQLNDRVSLDVGQVSLAASGEAGYAADLLTFTNDTDGDGYAEQFVRVYYIDAERRTEEFSFTLRNRSAGTVVASDTFQGSYGEFSAVYKVAENESDAAYRLTWNATREQADGTDKTISDTEYAGSVPGFWGDIPLDPRWASLIGYVSIVAVAGLIVITEPALGGLAATGWASLLTIIGIVTIPAPALGLGGALSVLALLGRVTR